jgi:hypothetical protein
LNSFASWRPTELPDSWAPTHGWATTRVLVLVAILAIAAFAWIESPWALRRLSAAAQRIGRCVLIGVLAVSAVFAVATYVDFGVFRYGTYLNEWDFYHYYVGTKYAPELGYTNLYGATLAADAETGLRYRNPHGEIRDLATAQIRDVASVAAESGRYRQRFSENRWREFVADIAWFKMQLPEKRWSLVLADHGYNGTPAWSFVVGGLFTRHLSVREPVGRWLMLLFDPLLLLATVVVVGWAFGVRAALLMVVFVGTHYLMSWGHLKGALLRTDFAMCSVLAVCLVKKGRYKLAGILLGWATLSRVFPAFLLVGPVVLLVGDLVRNRQLNRPLVGLLVASAATIVVVVLASCAYFGGTGIWHEWSSKIALHYAGGSDWDLGYRTVAEARFIRGVPVRAADLAVEAGQQAADLLTQGAEFVVLALLVVPALAFIRALEHHEAVAFGFVFVFLLSLATYYYYLILCVPLLFFASDLGKPQRALGAAFLFLTGSAGYVLFSGWQPLRELWVPLRGWHQAFPTYYFLSCLIAVSAAQMVIIAATKARALERAQPRTSSHSGP